MLHTGYILFITETGGGFDANNDPVAPVKVLGEYLPCNLRTITHNYLLLAQDGQHLQARYSAMIDGYYDLTNVQSVAFRDYDSKELGTFQIQLKEHLGLLVKQTKVVV